MPSSSHPTATCPLPGSLALSYLDELGAGRGQQVEGAGELPEEVLPGLPEARGPGPVQQLLQAGTGLHAPRPVEAAQRGAWGERGGEARAAAGPSWSRAWPPLRASETLTPTWALEGVGEHGRWGETEGALTVTEGTRSTPPTSPRPAPTPPLS